MNRINIIILSCVVSLSACHSADDIKVADTSNDSVSTMKLATDSNVVTAAIDSSYDAKNSIEWKGNYKGVLPCADCAGIVTEITLHDDGTYILSKQYLGKKDSRVNSQEGKFEWVNGSTVQLNGIKYAAAPQYLVEEGKIIQLGVDGKRVEGEFADRYIFKKH